VALLSLKRGGGYAALLKGEEKNLPGRKFAFASGKRKPVGRGSLVALKNHHLGKALHAGRGKRLPRWISLFVIRGKKYARAFLARRRTASFLVDHRDRRNLMEGWGGSA